MRFKHCFIYFFLFLFSFSIVNAQESHEHIVALKGNPYLVNYSKQAKKDHHFIWRLISDSIVLNLPFRDDFSHGGPYPDTALWVDNAAYINNTYPIDPPTIGVATLDGVNNEGRPYNPSCPPGASYPADSLTSRPINMAQYNATQRIWFSFYWQAGGRGFAPQTSDTLLLQFRTAHTPWTTVWYQLGYLPSGNDTGFHRVMIPMLDTVYFAQDSIGVINPFDGNFQFRFKNYACTSANTDQWNIDDIYINLGRSATDTMLNDVSFVYESPSLLANYQYMPWEQFTHNDLKDTMYVTERNNTTSAENTTYYFDTSSSALQPSFYHATENMIPTYPYYCTVPQLTHIPIKSNYGLSTFSGPTDITIQHSLKYASQPTLLKWDTVLSFKQIFSNYFAYDDSTAEASYFINGTTPMDLGVSFTVNNKDTLRGLELYFNYMFVNPANYNMILAVWDNSGPGGSPGNIIYQDDSVTAPRTSDSLNGYTFYPYHSPSPIIVGAGQTIYVGWIQTNGDSLNIGLDLNTNSTSKICYNDGAFPAFWSTGWNPSSLSTGSLMIRPVFGSVGFNFHSPLSDADLNTQVQTLGLYPNPANDMVTLSASMPQNTTLKIYTVDGRECVSNASFYGNSINTSVLPAGFYIVEVTPQGGQTSYQKLLIQR